MNDTDKIVALLRYRSQFHWYRSEREIWVLDWIKWQQDYLDAGHETPVLDVSDRFGIPVVDENTIHDFFIAVEEYRVGKTALSDALARRMPRANSWWDVGKLFPVVFVDSDRRHVSAFYNDGIRLERYVPDGWTSLFEDFASNSAEIVLPFSERFWIQNGVDMLAELNRRGENA
jgi:hypothetical protein